MPLRLFQVWPMPTSHLNYDHSLNAAPWAFHFKPDSASGPLHLLVSAWDSLQLSYGWFLMFWASASMTPHQKDSPQQLSLK
jgi:hypothetical protein